jgi:hypothetical protein
VPRIKDLQGLVVLALRCLWFAKVAKIGKVSGTCGTKLFNHSQQQARSLSRAPGGIEAEQPVVL